MQLEYGVITTAISGTGMSILLVLQIPINLLLDRVTERPLGEGGSVVLHMHMLVAVRRGVVGVQRSANTTMNTNGAIAIAIAITVTHSLTTVSGSRQRIGVALGEGFPAVVEEPQEERVLGRGQKEVLRHTY